MSDSLRPRGLQHTRLPCSSPSSGVCSNSCPLSQWCHPIFSSSVVPFSSCLQSFPASGSFPVSPFFTSGGQSIGASHSASVLPMNFQDWFPLGLNHYIYPCIFIFFSIMVYLLQDIKYNSLCCIVWPCCFIYFSYRSLHPLNPDS